jgi:Ca2+/Na+ antiporter
MPDGLVEDKGIALYIDAYRKQYRDTSGKASTPYLAQPLTGGDKPKLPSYLTTELTKLYAKYAARSKSKSIHSADMKVALEAVGLKYSHEKFDKLFADADKDRSNFLDKGEFLEFFSTIITSTEPLPWESKAEAAGGDDDGDDDDEEMPDEFKHLPPAEQEKAIMRESLKSMAIGTLLVLIFSDPMVDVLSQIGVMTGVPPFYVAFLLAPLASNASELVSSYKLATKKTKTSITQSLQTLEGAACMNNTYCLGIFMALIYVQGLAWKFTAETTAIVLVQFLVFGVVMKGSTQPVLNGFIVFSFYPLSLILVAALEASGLD